MKLRNETRRVALLRGGTQVDALVQIRGIESRALTIRTIRPREIVVSDGSGERRLRLGNTNALPIAWAAAPVALYMAGRAIARRRR